MLTLWCKVAETSVLYQNTIIVLFVSGIERFKQQSNLDRQVEKQYTKYSHAFFSCINMLHRVNN